MGWGARDQKTRLDTGRDVVVGLGEEVGLVSCSLDRDEGLDEEGLDLPGSVGESCARVGIEERRSGLLEQVREGVGAVVVPLRGLQQRQIPSVALQGKRSKHLRHRRHLRDHPRPCLPSAAPEPVILLICLIIM